MIVWPGLRIGEDFVMFLLVLAISFVGGGVNRDVHEGWAEVYGRVKEIRGRRG